MRFLGHILTIIFPLVGFAQSATDCPTWGKSNKKSKADYFKYLSHNQGKKVSQITPEQQQQTTVTEQQRIVPIHVNKTGRTATSTGSSSTSDFYTTRRYNLFPEEKKKAKIEKEIKEVGEFTEGKKEEVKNKDEVTEDVSAKNKTELTGAKKEVPQAIETNPEEPKIDEVQKASSAAAASSADEVNKSSANNSSSKFHKRKRSKIFNPDLKHNAVKRNRRIGGKHRLDRCATKF